MLAPASMLIAAHRGDTSLAHENTIEACERAISSGADMVELDVRRTADGVLVVHHDECLGSILLRTIGYETAVRDARNAGFALARFDELLGAAKGRVLLDVEVKEAGYEDEVVRTLTDAGFAPEDFVITSFDGAVLPRVRKIAPWIETGLLVEQMTGAGGLDAFRRCGAQFLAPDWTILDEATLAEAAASRITLMPWVVNDPAAMGGLLNAPAVAGVITDRVSEALRIRAGISGDPASSRRRRHADPRRSA